MTGIGLRIWATPRDRLAEKVDPAGHRLSYAYDLHGNLTTITADVGGRSFTAATTYDAIHRPVTVTDSQGGVTSLSYHEWRVRATRT